MTENRRQWAAWTITVLLTLAIALFFGVQYPLPEPPEEPIEPVPLAANFTNPVDIEGSSSASAPALTFEDDTDTGIFRSAANTLNVSSGGTEMLEIDSSGFTISSGTSLDVDTNLDLDGGGLAADVSGAVSLDADQASNFNTTAGDITIEAETGSITIKADEGVADAVFIDANDAVTTGIDIDIGTSASLAIDGGLTDIGGGSGSTADGDNDLLVAGDLEVDDELEVDGRIDADNGVDAAIGAENVGSLPTILTQSVVTTTNNGAIATIADGEIWFVWNVYCNVTTNFDCTGDDCTLDIGDGNDQDGLLDLDDGELQTSDVDVTNGTAGWQGYGSDTIGAFLAAGAGFIYAPSGAAETIDLTVGGTSPTAGQATCYIIYTRIQ